MQSASSYFLLSLLLVMIGCKKESLPTNKKRILHIAHTRSSVDGIVNNKIRAVDYAAFDVLCLGGDIDGHTTADERIIALWDELFSFSEPTTLWTLGNHDIDNRELVEKFTKRPTFYTWNYESITFLVLDDQLDRTNIIGNQLALVENLADTIQETDHLIVLTHNLLWMYGNEILEPLVDEISNAPIGNCLFCIKPNNFYEAVYPQLLKVKEKGINVLCIAGDLGVKTNEFEYLTPEGIHFLASGVDIEQNIDNQALVLELAIDDATVDWRFHSLSDL